MSDRGIVEIRVISTTNGVAAIKALRNATSLTVADIRDSFARKIPIAVTRIFGGDHDEAEQRLLTLLNALNELGAEYEIIVDGETETREYLNNILQLWREVQLETRMMTNLEIGQPDIETLAWLQREAPTDVFRLTLEQIVSDGRYNVDAETLAWVKQQLGNA